MRLQFIGNRASFAPRLLKNMLDVEELTRNNTGMVVTVAADYGGQWDIGQACRAIAMDVHAGLTDPTDINTGSLQKYISLGTEPAPDLCIRTGGERRISNFLLWQMAYIPSCILPTATGLILTRRHCSWRWMILVSASVDMGEIHPVMN